MIRTAYPIPRFFPFRQARLRLDEVSRRTRRVQARRQNKMVASAAAPLPPTPAVMAVAVSPATYAQWQTEKAALDVFYDRYDGLTALICLAAQEGVTEIRESRYQTARTWLMDAYAAGIQRGVAPYLAVPKTNEESATDPFACFWTPPTLVDLLHHDDGNLIERMEQTQNALAAWEKSLRVRLAARQN